MMKLRFIIIFTFFAMCGISLHAELSVVKDSSDNYASTIFTFNETQHNEFWKKFSNNPNRALLNENGDLNGDGRPSFAINSFTGFPEVAWSRFDINKYEIVYSFYSGAEWSNYEFLTNDNIDDFDPFIVVSEDGTVKIAWWSNELIPQVYYKIKKYTSNWSLVLQISDPLEKSKYPSIAPYQNLSYVAYETIDSSNNKSIVAEIIDDNDPIPHVSSKTTIGTSTFPNNTMPTVHAMNQHVWVDWIYDENYLAWSEKIGDQWTQQRYEPYSSSEDIPRARLYIKIKVLNNQ
ncbi:MAG: hypothetical protein AB1756_10385 [Acidobacteriota bacterium]